MPSSIRSTRALLAAFAALGGFLSLSNAQSVATTPVGAVTISVPAGTGSAYNVSQIAVPLLASPLVPGTSGPEAPAGLLRATVASVTSNTITTTSAGWTASQLIQAGYPMFVRVLTGANAGRTLQITGNTNTTLTVDNQGTDLTTLGFVAGTDTYEIVAGDTIRGLFGTPTDGVVGGTAAQFTANQTDRVTINVAGSVFNYYYNTDFSQWRRSGNPSNQDNVVISPQAGIVYQRIGTGAYSITALGNVPTTASKVAVTRPSVLVVGRQFPTDTTLGALGIENIPNWRRANAGGVVVADSDRVLIKVSGTIFSYFYDANTSTWKRSGNPSSQNGVAVTADSAIRLQRSGTSGVDIWNVAPNYTL